MSGVPILVDGRRQRVLVVGGGAVAARKAEMLAAAGASVRVVAPEVGEPMRALVDAGRVTREERRYRAGDIGDATLVIAATDDRATNAAVAADAHAAHRLVNVADAATEGSFATMATHRADGLVVGVSAGVPAAASRIRDAIAARFDARYAAALGTIAALRDRMLAAGQATRWRQASAEVMGDRFCDAVEKGEIEARLRPWR